MDDNVLQEIVDLTATKRDQQFYILSGAFMARFAHVEMMVTSLLAVLLRMKDLRAFHIITKGMDARVKIERLKQLAIHRNGSIGKTFKTHLDYFESNMIPVRNDLAHGALWGNQKEVGKWHVVTLETMETANFTDDGLDKAPKAYLAQDLSARATWCEQFFQELAQAFAHARRGEILEIDHPTIQVPKDTQKGPPQPKTSAKRHRPPRKTS